MFVLYNSTYTRFSLLDNLFFIENYMETVSSSDVLGLISMDWVKDMIRHGGVDDLAWTIWNMAQEGNDEAERLIDAANGDDNVMQDNEWGQLVADLHGAVVSASNQYDLGLSDVQMWK